MLYGIRKATLTAEAMDKPAVDWSWVSVIAATDDDEDKVVCTANNRKYQNHNQKTTVI